MVFWQRLWQVTLSTVKALMWIGVASFVMSVLSDFVSSPQDPALTADFLRSVEQLDVEKFKGLVERSKVHVDADPQSEGTALYKLCSQKETETTLLMVDLLLKRPDINPNGSPSAWTPLKAAVGLQNHQTVKLLLDHPETLTQINVAGLDCSIVPRLPERVVLVLDATAPECFRSHVATLDAKDPDVIPLSAVQITMRGKKKAGALSTAKASQPTDGNAEGPAAKGATTRQTPTSKPASSSSSSSHAKLKPLHEAPVVPGYLGSPDELEFPAPLVVDPTKWDSFSSVLAYYLGLHSLPSVRGLAIAWIAIVSSTLYFGVKVARRAQALGGAADVPPAPPAAAAEAVLQAEAPPVQ